MTTEGTVRMDKWLWAVRIFKTRTLAARACDLGRVTVGGAPVKPARQVKISDVIVVKKEDMTLTYKVLQLPRQRVGATAARQFAEDLTPESERQKLRQPRLEPLFYRPKGAGRPTKKERRALNDILESS